jgi:zinc-ribbon domain
MSLIKCSECGEKISKKAKACPSCGSPAKKKTSMVTWLVAVIFAAFVFVAFDSDYAPPAKAKQVAATALTAEELREKEVSKGFSAWDGSHIELEQWVKQSLKDPGSYEHIETRYSDEGGHIALIMRYRAKNGFGGYTVGRVVATAAVDGALTEIVSSQ